MKAQYRIVITPVMTESGFRDSKVYEVQKGKKKGWFKKTIEWETVKAFTTIGEANALLKQLLVNNVPYDPGYDGRNNKRSKGRSGYSGYSGFSGRSNWNWHIK